MIMRIFGEGQYELPDGTLAAMDELDEEVEAALDAGDEQRFRELYGRLLAHIREAGTPLAADDLRTSELMLPSAESRSRRSRAIFRATTCCPSSPSPHRPRQPCERR